MEYDCQVTFHLASRKCTKSSLVARSKKYILCYSLDREMEIRSTKDKKMAMAKHRKVVGNTYHILYILGIH